MKKTIKKIEKMHLLFGKCEGHKCKECNQFIREELENQKNIFNYIGG